MTTNPPFSHPGLTHRNGDECILLPNGYWFFPFDAGGEGETCPNPEHESEIPHPALSSPPHSLTADTRTVLQCIAELSVVEFPSRPDLNSVQAGISFDTIRAAQRALASAPDSSPAEWVCANFAEPDTCLSTGATATARCSKCRTRLMHAEFTVGLVTAPESPSADEPRWAECEHGVSFDRPCDDCDPVRIRQNRQTPAVVPDRDALAEVIAGIWRDHSDCNWVSTGVNVVWSCGILHPGPIHMQPTTRDRHVAALVMTQVLASGLLRTEAEVVDEVVERVEALGLACEGGCVGPGLCDGSCVPKTSRPAQGGGSDG